MNATSTTENRWKRLGVAALFVIGCELVGIIGALTTATGGSSWYAALEKPSFTPPDWLFGPVWTLLYALMGIAAFLVWREGWRPPRSARAALGLFAAQLVLNGIWTPVFFGAEQIAGGAVVIVALWLALALTIRAFFRVSRLAGWLLVPYLLWVTYAAALNFAIWALN